MSFLSPAGGSRGIIFYNSRMCICEWMNEWMGEWGRFFSLAKMSTLQTLLFPCVDYIYHTTCDWEISPLSYGIVSFYMSEMKKFDFKNKRIKSSHISFYWVSGFKLSKQIKIYFGEEALIFIGFYTPYIMWVILIVYCHFIKNF